jgi:hypothetical protein
MSDASGCERVRLRVAEACSNEKDGVMKNREEPAT